MVNLNAINFNLINKINCHFYLHLLFLSFFLFIVFIIKNAYYFVFCMSFMKLCYNYYTIIIINIINQFFMVMKQYKYLTDG